jgi:alcohol dehydrogenase class IV
MLTEAGISSIAFGVATEPSIERVRAAVALVAEVGCDAVLGFGGGSALDVGKAVAVLATSGADPLDHLEVIGGGRPLTRPGLPCVAVPTTAGTGSEVTRNSVLSGGGVKASLRSPLMLPKVAVIDPDLLIGVPRPTIAASGMDALSQLIEPLLSRRANPFTDALARDGMRRSARSLSRAYQEGMEDPGIREDLALASLFGGLCLANSGLGAVHGLAAAAGARLSAPHGAVCAAVLTAAMDVNLRALHDRAPEHQALARMTEVASLLTGQPDATPEEAIAWLQDLTTALSIPGLANYGLNHDGISEVVTAAQSASSMRGNPIDLSDEEVSEIVTRSL